MSEIVNKPELLESLHDATRSLFSDTKRHLENCVWLCQKMGDKDLEQFYKEELERMIALEEMVNQEE